MTRKRITIAAAALIAAAGIGLAAYASAQGGGPGFYGGGPGFGRHMGMGGGPLISRALALKDDLKLNQNQVERLEKLRADFYKKAARERIEMQALHLDLQKLHLQDKVDTAAAERLIRALEKKRGDMQIERLKAIEEAKTLLTPGQLEKLQTTGFGRGMGMGPGMMGPGMMGPGAGMMGPGQGRGMGPGMMGGGWGGQTTAETPAQRQ